MAISSRVLWLPKLGHGAEEYEDAFAVSAEPTFPFRAAVADGATESAFSGGWARALVAGYLTEGDFMEAAASARRHWSAAPDSRWYVQAKATEGAHAAFLVLELDPGTWSAESVGDCCLFLVRDGRTILSWPFNDPDAFNHRPPLVSSRSEAAPESLTIASGTWRKGDTFILATDAMAAWLLSSGTGELLHTDDFEGMVDVARAADEGGGRSDRNRPPLRNDDVTAILIDTA